MDRDTVIQNLSTDENLIMVLKKVYEGNDSAEVKEATQYLKIFSEELSALPRYFSLMT